MDFIDGKMQTNFPYDLSLKMDSNPSLPGLDDFLKSLERIFFAESEVKLVSDKTGANQLILNLRCHLSLLDVLYHFRQGQWGHCGDAECCSAENDHLKAQLENLQSRNPQPVDIEEVNLELDDVLIVVRSTGPGSIATEIIGLFQALGEHYVHYTRGLRAVPYEIYIPVSESVSPASQTPSDNPSDAFYNYWAVYYEDAVDAKIYSLKQRQILAEDLYYSDSE